jgi:hypothetical protein
MKDRMTEMTRSAAIDRARAARRWYSSASRDAAIVGSAITINRSLPFRRSENGSADLKVNARRLAGKHASLRTRADLTGRELEEHASRNGTFVDGAASVGGFGAEGTVRARSWKRWRRRCCRQSISHASLRRDWQFAIATYAIEKL